MATIVSNDRILYRMIRWTTWDKPTDHDEGPVSVTKDSTIGKEIYTPSDNTVQHLESHQIIQWLDRVDGLYIWVPTHLPKVVGVPPISVRT